MDALTKWYVRANELRCKWTKGQTMTEYALIMAAIAVVCYGAYNVLGGEITSKVQSVGADLSS